MKNLHLLPTERVTESFFKPSRLLMSKRGHLQFLKDNASLNPTQFLKWSLEGVYQNIYITSSEEIKLNDYVIQTNFEKTNTQLIQCVDEFQVRIANDKDGSFTKKKIILTTDQDLINDGIQSIDDEFLEWFVKNPSCEEFKVIIEGYKKNGMIDESTSYKYKIITPKEEQKQHLIDIMKGDEELGLYEEPKQDYSGVHLRHCYQGEYEDGCKYGEDDCPAKPKEEPKQETPEEREPYWDLVDAKAEQNNRIDLDAYANGVLDGVKWQQEKMYSEEEVNEIIAEAWNSCEDNEGETFTEVRKRIIEQFKNK